MVAALPTAAQKLIVGNTFIGTSVVQWFGDTILGVHADNTFQSCNARTGIGGLMIGGALQVGALCYKGAPGQVFFTEYLGNTMIDSVRKRSSPCSCLVQYDHLPRRAQDRQNES